MFTTANYQKAKWIHLNCNKDAVKIKKNDRNFNNLMRHIRCYIKSKFTTELNNERMN